MSALKLYPSKLYWGPFLKAELIYFKVYDSRVLYLKCLIFGFAHYPDSLGVGLAGVGLFGLARAEESARCRELPSIRVVKAEVTSVLNPI